MVWLCLEAGAKQVKVLDHTCHDARKAYKESGIQDAVRGLKDPRAVVEFVDQRRFVKVKAEKAKALASLGAEVVEADVDDADNVLLQMRRNAQHVLFLLELLPTGRP
mgnify:CR=1 FL=1